MKKYVSRFWSKVRKTSSCWIWTRGCNGGAGYRYGVCYVPQRKLAHRYSLELYLGRPLLDGECALHRCDNPKCVNPNHLFLGTQADNVRDMSKKGRNRGNPNASPPSGERNPNAKLCASDVRRIRKLSRLGYTATALSKMFCVSNVNIGSVLSYKTWKHV